MTSCQPPRPHGPQFCLRFSGKRWYEYAKLLIFLHPTKRYAPFSLFECCASMLHTHTITSANKVDIFFANVYTTPILGSQYLKSY